MRYTLHYVEGDFPERQPNDLWETVPDQNKDTIGAVAFHPLQPVLLSISGSRHFDDGGERGVSSASEDSDSDSSDGSDSDVAVVKKLRRRPQPSKLAFGVVELDQLLIGRPGGHRHASDDRQKTRSKGGKRRVEYLEVEEDRETAPRLALVDDDYVLAHFGLTRTNNESMITLSTTHVHSHQWLKSETGASGKSEDVNISEEDEDEKVEADTYGIDSEGAEANCW
ncbi:hypothetical protein BU15DRAFT_66649 [Melanogaster broomeanus]|nr:hypothetical protein BU15DRAFT_66649 [Melanogaster broomeanus]